VLLIILYLRRLAFFDLCPFFAHCTFEFLHCLRSFGPDDGEPSGCASALLTGTTSRTDDRSVAASAKGPHTIPTTTDPGKTFFPSPMRSLPPGRIADTSFRRFEKSALFARCSRLCRALLNQVTTACEAILTYRPVLEIDPPFRIILYWTILKADSPENGGYCG